MSDPAFLNHITTPVMSASCEGMYGAVADTAAAARARADGIRPNPRPAAGKGGGG